MTEQEISLPKIAEGSEHSVFFSESDSLVFKTTLPRVFGDWYYLVDGKMNQEKSSPLEYLVRLRLWDKLFRPAPDALGVTAQGQIVSTHKFIAGSYPNQELVDEFLLSAGLTAAKQSCWLWKKTYAEKEFAIWIGDTRADNFVLSSNEIIPIDLRLWFGPTDY